MATVRSQWTARPLGNFSENIPSLHVWTGYVLGALVVLRILWGFIGPEHARFGDFMFLPPVILGYLLDLARLRSKRYLGHSPAGAAMFFVPLRGMPAVVGTGLVVYESGYYRAGFTGLGASAPRSRSTSGPVGR